MSFPETKYNVHSPEGLRRHCEVASLIMTHMEIDPHTKHHIRNAIREATLKVTTRAGSGKYKAEKMSENSLNQMMFGSSSGLVMEHAVPVSLINEWVLQLGQPAPQKIAQIVYEWTELCIITEDEHVILREKGLSKEMPKNWDRRDKFARYKEVGIRIVDRRYSELANTYKK